MHPVNLLSLDPKDNLYQDQSTSYLVVSGGTGCNGIASAFGSNVTHVLPVSDNGGSSSEVWDIRSRLIRLIPEAPPASPTEAIRRLLSHRFSVDLTEQQAKEEWRDLVEGRSPLWKGIPPDRKETIRGFLVYFEGELLRRAHKRFSFRNGSVGNYFLTAVHLFLRSVPSAIFLFSSITARSPWKAHILPVLVTNHTVTIAAELANGSRIIGQCEISHPVAPSTPRIVVRSELDDAPALDEEQDIDDAVGTFPKSPEHNSLFAKPEQDQGDVPLESRIRRVFYINPYGQEVFPRPNSEFLGGLRSRDVLVYSVGSLWTSIIPCLALQGVGSAIARSPTLRAKVFLLNAYNDRETGGYTGVDYVLAVAETLNRHDGQKSSTQPSFSVTRAPDYPISAFITHLVYLRGTTIEVDELALTALGVQCVPIDPQPNDKGKLLYTTGDVKLALARILDESD
ncbi:hypothetical protein M407DRAFT_231889 [Tulasnella calospora MUT 4182]|uniref:Uncharacterized protein n=1 Tax=Tulasnella calospora MUT 4182 TaxID=1051891 RepID=A0A0C3LI64_9AGAM|nr:hypothetical protein M407DRAFT_231889 [Tulasnella calospora MUT 4182]